MVGNQRIWKTIRRKRAAVPNESRKLEDGGSSNCKTQRLGRTREGQWHNSSKGASFTVPRVVIAAVGAAGVAQGGWMSLPPPDVCISRPVVRLRADRRRNKAEARVSSTLRGRSANNLFNRCQTFRRISLRRRSVVGYRSPTLTVDAGGSTLGAKWLRGWRAARGLFTCHYDSVLGPCITRDGVRPLVIYHI